MHLNYWFDDDDALLTDDDDDDVDLQENSEYTRYMKYDIEHQEHRQTDHIYLIHNITTLLLTILHHY